ncbi:MAG TPA: GreA/GreB family elongation factor [Opitutaceae bacterium]
MTAPGAARLRHELAQFLEVERPRLRSRMPDEEARVELQKLDGRIRQIQESLRTAEISESTVQPDFIVRFGSHVSVRDATGAQEDYHIVGVDETDFFPGAISWLSPLAQALLNQQVHARVSVQTPAGTRELEITRIW